MKYILVGILLAVVAIAVVDVSRYRAEKQAQEQAAREQDEAAARRIRIFLVRQAAQIAEEARASDLEYIRMFSEADYLALSACYIGGYDPYKPVVSATMSAERLVKCNNLSLTHQTWLKQQHSSGN